MAKYWPPQDTNELQEEKELHKTVVKDVEEILQIKETEELESDKETEDEGGDKWKTVSNIFDLFCS